MKNDSGRVGALAKSLVNQAKYLWVLRTPQDSNSKEEGA